MGGLEELRGMDTVDWVGPGEAAAAVGGVAVDAVGIDGGGSLVDSWSFGPNVVRERSIVVVGFAG